MERTTPKPFVFVLMPFDPEFDDVYKLGIKPACNQAGAYAERVDEQLFDESILDRIYNQISKADVIVSDMTGRNPNVFYETGYAHALGQKVILITKKSEDIPFDLKHYPHIIYGGRIADLIGELEKKVRWALQQPKVEIPYHGVQFYIDGHLLPNDKEITWPVSDLPRSDLFLKIDAHNSIEKHIRTARFQIGILIDYDLIIRTLNNDRCPAFGQPDGKTLCLFQDRLELLPGAWQSISMRFSAKGKGPWIEYGLFSAVLRLFSEDGVADFPFRIAVVEKDQT